MDSNGSPHTALRYPGGCVSWFYQGAHTNLALVKLMDLLLEIRLKRELING